MGEQASDARGSAIRDAIVMLLLLAAAVALGLAVARLLLEPIKAVRLGALEVANEHLPTALRKIRAGEEPDPVEPLPVHTGEEVGQLARAVDVLHGEAIHLATQQARLREQVSAMFETLSRRSTSLINQQLGLIENLERDEDDPRRLESLFRLDHLAARIRRNGESLLVLSGSAPRGGAGQDLPLADVLRASISEVQDYQRVRLSVTDLVVRAGAAPNLIHLFAELIDNALSYSPPDSLVTVASVRGVDGGTLVEVIDDGLGMTPKAIEEANKALITGGEVTTETARRMGLYVVGQLAIRHDVTVRIRSNPDSAGTIVAVSLPAAILAAGRDTELKTDPAAPVADEPADEATYAPVASFEEAQRQRNLSAVPSPAPAEPGGLTGVASSATPTTLPHVPVAPPEAPAVTPPAAQAGSGLPRRQPGASNQPASAAAPTTPVAPPPAAATPPRPAWATSRPTEPVAEPFVESSPASTAASVEAPAPVEEARPSFDIADLEPAPVEETPIFGQMQTSWLSENDNNTDLPWATREIDEGWKAAERAEAAEPAGRSSSGLPMRRPGSTLVPGQAGTSGGAAARRDPEAIRAHLNRHLAGVRRGRMGTADTTEARTPVHGSTLLDEEMDRS
ncbi:histidine kinase [Knoellia subterranea KCTC 19937]|uniref:histidine kinase n=1 Tax=Knoellia subterranea KCTC 19937 TaxID=1385521 RepID=A0A0A0JSW8_9MICO|nr:histidine kinase [Knoellia subterranea KCTC 19937]